MTIPQLFGMLITLMKVFVLNKAKNIFHFILLVFRFWSKFIKGTKKPSTVFEGIRFQYQPAKVINKTIKFWENCSLLGKQRPLTFQPILLGDDKESLEVVTIESPGRENLKPLLTRQNSEPDSKSNGLLSTARGSKYRPPYPGTNQPGSATLPKVKKVSTLAASLKAGNTSNEEHPHPSEDKKTRTARQVSGQVLRTMPSAKIRMEDYEQINREFFQQHPDIFVVSGYESVMPTLFDSRLFSKKYNRIIPKVFLRKRENCLKKLKWAPTSLSVIIEDVSYP